MKLKKIISVLEDCHTKLHYFCDDAESTPWYAEARKQLRYTIKFMERHLTQQSSGREIAETFCLDCKFDYGSSNCHGCEHYSRR